MSRSLDAIAKRQLRPANLPVKLRDILQRVFRDPDPSSQDRDASRWLNEVKKTISTGTERRRREVVTGYDAVVSNAIVLIYLLDSGPETRNLISCLSVKVERRGEKRANQIAQCLEVISCFQGARYLEYAVFGVIPEKIDRILKSLSDESFDILKNLLPSPFEGSDLSIIGRHYDQSVPWLEYRTAYESAEANFERGDLYACVKELEALVAGSVVRIPVAEGLLARARSKLTEHEELRSILGKI